MGVDADSQRMSVAADRGGAVVRVSVVGIVANVVLAAFKAVVGLGANSIAIVLDAVNNLSDAVSSLVTIVGTRLAARRADHDHPFGYGRLEYVTTIVIAAIVLWAGITSLGESLTRFVHPEQASYDVVSLVIVGVAAGAKVALGLYTRSKGVALSSGALVASGTDALTDSALSAATLVSALVNVLMGVNVDAVLGIVIALVIVRAGVEIVRDAIDKILGERVDPEVARRVSHAVADIDGVRGVYDLILNDFGPNRLWGSVHIEVDEGMTAREIDVVTRQVQRRVYDDCGVILHTVGVYSVNTDDADATELRRKVTRIALSHEYVMQVHGFYLDERTGDVSLDVVISFDAPSRGAVYDAVLEDLRRHCPGHAFLMALDSDVSG